MRRFWLATATLTSALAAAMALTLLVPGFGVPLAHTNAGIVATALAGALGWRALRARRVATLALAYSGVAATVSGFAMLLSQDLPYKEWVTWWHVVTSVAFGVAFLRHWTNNHPRLVELVRGLFAPPSAVGAATAAAWTGVLLLGAWTALPDVRVRFVRETYVNIGWWTIVGGVALAYGPWLLHRVPRLRARLDERAYRRRARGVVDASLFLSNWGAILTGFALVWLADPLRAGPLKYPSKWWHTATSVLLLAFVALHVGFNARALAKHAERADEDLRRA